MSKYAGIEGVVVESAGRFVKAWRDPEGRVDVYWSAITGVKGSLAGKARWLDSRGCVDRDSSAITNATWALIDASIRAVDSAGALVKVPCKP